MKVTSNNERHFISNCITKEKKRPDGRQLLEGRTLEIAFGNETGCCMVLLGNTRILAQVSCEITEPNVSTPSEGILLVNLELSAIASAEAKFLLRSSEEVIETQRLLERFIKDSKCIDLESLCIIPGSKVWTLRVDIHTLDDGNLIECASIAVISALAHFKHPEVTVVRNDVIVHTLEEKEPKPLRIRFMPITINLAFFDQGKYILVDPTEIEERISDGCYAVALNAYQEICFVHRSGILLFQDDVKRCEDIAVKRAQEVTQAIRNALDDDAYKRAAKATVGYTNFIHTGTVLGTKRPIAEISFDAVQNGENEIAEQDESSIEILDISEDGEKTHKIGSSRAKKRSLRLKGQLSRAKACATKLLKPPNVTEEKESAIIEEEPSEWEEGSNEDDKFESINNVSSDNEEIELISIEESVYVNEDQVCMKPKYKRMLF